MPQSIWSGTISFGLVMLPVKLYPATKPRDVRFHEFDAGTVSIKDLREGKQREGDAADREAWVKQRFGQRTVARGEMIATRIMNTTMSNPVRDFRLRRRSAIHPGRRIRPRWMPRFGETSGRSSAVGSSCAIRPSAAVGRGRS